MSTEEVVTVRFTGRASTAIEEVRQRLGGTLTSGDVVGISLGVELYPAALRRQRRRRMDQKKEWEIASESGRQAQHSGGRQMSADAKQTTLRELNDAFRTSMDARLGCVRLTVGVDALPSDIKA